eukprot:GHVO01052553.1.p1 GENE.GHVO01052553.1~~GHVO01052553.1.p1  ORF type:complete len:263 (-),score=44.07 GHVO01052553.1:169-915(-)
MVAVFKAHPHAINDRIRDLNNNTFVGVCVDRNRLRELRWLNEHGADFTVTDNFGNSVLHMVNLSRSGGRDELARPEETDLWMSAPDCLDASAAVCTFRRALDVLCFLLASTGAVAMLNAKNGKHDTPAHALTMMAPHPLVALKALQLLHAGGASFSITNGEASVNMTLALHFGNGPWLLWASAKEGRLDPLGMDNMGRTLRDCIEVGSQWDQFAEDMPAPSKDDGPSELSMADALDLYNKTRKRFRQM